jgi:hypothetical protein
LSNRYQLLKFETSTAALPLPGGWGVVPVELSPAPGI